MQTGDSSTTPNDLRTNINLAPWRTVNALADALNKGAKKKSFTTHSLRHVISAAPRNGLAPYIRRIGKKILISEPGFNRWITESTETVQSDDGY